MQRELGGAAGLVSEILAGRQARPLPASVTAALDQLRAARAARPIDVLAGDTQLP